MLHIDNACITLGGHILFSHFNMHLSKGESACIIGASGCGKSSLLNAIMGFLPLAEGIITVNGMIMGQSTVDRIRQVITWVPQELNFPLEWVSDMVDLLWHLKANRSVPFSKDALFGIFDQLELSHTLYQKRMNDISIGQKQRIMLAVSSLLDKPLMIVDEPTSALDSKSTIQVLRFFQQEAQKGKAVLIVSHNKKFASQCGQLVKL